MGQTESTVAQAPECIFSAKNLLNFDSQNYIIFEIIFETLII